MHLPGVRAKSLGQTGRSVPLALIACVLLRPALAQVPTIEELEQRIEEAKKAQQAAEASKAQPPAAADREQAAAPPKQATLIVRNDAPCLLSIDTRRVGNALPAGVREIAVEPGQRSIQCTSTDEPAISASLLVKIDPGDRTVVQLRLKEKVAAESGRRQQIAAARDSERRRKDEERATGKRGPLDPVSGGLLRDPRGLVWSATDNGQDVDWDGADRYCTHRGMGLPTVAQLQGLVDRSGTMSTPCQGRQCKVSGQFHLTGFKFWSKQREGARWAVFVHLDNGRKSFDYTGSRDKFRALCVRSA